MHNQKSFNILSMQASERLDYFVDKICDFDELWGLYDNGWAVSETDNEIKVISFWSEQAFAEMRSVGKWNYYLQKAILLNDFINKWLPGMEKDGVLVGAFQTPTDKAVVLTSSVVSKLIKDELDS